jgi:hypothetical protein
MVNDNKTFGRNRAIAHRAAALLVAITLLACGGDGGGGDGRPSLSAPTTPISINAANADAIAAAAVAAAAGQTLTGAADMAIGAKVEADGSSAQQVVGRITSQTLRRVVAANSAPSVTGAVQSEPCLVSGTVTFSGSETSFSAVFAQCSDSEGEVANGRIEVTNVSSTGDQYAGSASATVWMDLSLTTSGATTRIVGDFTAEASWTSTTESSRLHGNSLGYTDGVTTEVLSNFDMSVSIDTSLASASSDFTLASTALGGAVTVDTQTAIQGYTYGEHPYAGVVVVSGSGGTKVRVTILGDETEAAPHVRVEVDADGNGTFETTYELSWSELEAA